MECLAQLLDEIEDLIYAAALKAERIRATLEFFLVMAMSITLQILGVYVALTLPPVALAMASLLAVGTLFHAVVNHSATAYAN